ncbi:MAG: glycosyltransferase family 4 protein [Acidobacteriia bacterium]|nr:glycosyltransferase family 4 protein [Terriglobia bacterium]
MIPGAADSGDCRAPIALHVRMGSARVGGIDRALVNLAIGLQATGGELHLAILDDGRTDWPLLRSLCSPTTVRLHRVQGAFRFDPRIAVRLAAIGREIGAAVLHAWDYKSDVFAMLASARLRLPWVATRHGFAFETPRLRLYGKVDRIALRYAARVFAVSEALAASLGPRSVVRLVPNAVPVPPEPPRGEIASPRRLVAVGRLEPEKGFDLLLDALRTCVDSVPDLRLTIVGDGSQRRELEKRTARLGLAAVVSFTGWLTDVTSVLDAAELLVVPSRRDSQPMVLLEGMARGLPAVVTSVGEMAGLVSEPATGIVIPPGDSRALAESLLLASRSVFDGAAAWARVRRDHSPERLTAIYLDEYRALAARRCVTKRSEPR